MLTENKKFVSGSMGQWYNNAPKSQQQKFGARIQTIKDTLDKEEMIPSSPEFIDLLPAEITKYLIRGLETQKRQRDKFNAEVTSLRTSYHPRLMTELDRLKKAGLNSQAAVIRTEIDGMGQTSESFRAHLMN